MGLFLSEPVSSCEELDSPAKVNSLIQEFVLLFTSRHRDRKFVCLVFQQSSVFSVLMWILRLRTLTLILHSKSLV